MPNNTEFKGMDIFEIDTEYIQLDQLLKACNLVNSGGEAHILVEDGEVRLNGSVETRKRAKIRNNDIVEVNGIRIKIKSKNI